jgi:hypothetical protein
MCSGKAAMNLFSMRAGPHPRALRLDSRRSLAAAAGAFIMERAEYAVELDV